jgi:YD repeat-containing protein
LLLSICACNTNHKNYLTLIENDWKKEALKGNVKIIVRTSDNKNGTTGPVTTEYNNKGFITKRREELQVNGVTYTTAYLYEYDTTHNCTYITQMINDEKKGQDVYKYDNQGNLVEIARSQSTSTYTYDKQNRMLEELNYTGNNLFNKVTNQYLANGNKISDYIDGGTNTKKYETIENDTQKIYQSFEPTGALISTWLYKKDAKGNIIYTEERDAANKVEGYTHNYFNQYNDEVQSITFKTSTNKLDTLAFNYTYDAAGNWTRVAGVWTRQIMYW